MLNYGSIANPLITYSASHLNWEANKILLNFVATLDSANNGLKDVYNH